MENLSFGKCNLFQLELILGAIQDEYAIFIWVNGEKYGYGKTFDDLYWTAKCLKRFLTTKNERYNDELTQLSIKDMYKYFLPSEDLSYYISEDSDSEQILERTRKYSLWFGEQLDEYNIWTPLSGENVHWLMYDNTKRKYFPKQIIPISAFILVSQQMVHWYETKFQKNISIDPHKFP